MTVNVGPGSIKFPPAPLKLPMSSPRILMDICRPTNRRRGCGDALSNAEHYPVPTASQSMPSKCANLPFLQISPMFPRLIPSNPKQKVKTHLDQEEEIRVLRLGSLSVSLFDVMSADVDTHFAYVLERASDSEQEV